MGIFEFERGAVWEGQSLLQVLYLASRLPTRSFPSSAAVVRFFHPPSRFGALE